MIIILNQVFFKSSFFNLNKYLGALFSIICQYSASIDFDDDKLHKFAVSYLLTGVPMSRLDEIKSSVTRD
ncbi:hypothetical protein BpHYR1_025888 [Brachionus plicatilis]|uniref:Uncharacterized protein n=1 Tax=Brachionus plicatilis TaxID=10195 RepID=A0A3M7Q1N9_BRAPC|nr:hypothetical protein BpHYR1_025888 [Brachionus plicatilis]